MTGLGQMPARRGLLINISHMQIKVGFFFLVFIFLTKPVPTGLLTHTFSLRGFIQTLQTLSNCLYSGYCIFTHLYELLKCVHYRVKIESKVLNFRNLDIQSVTLGESNTPEMLKKPIVYC